jgi:glycosyltransferase involved in cell wall biosynthesis/SAM-dependent methyltransferase
VGKDKKVVEFGCSSGCMSEILKNEFGCQVVGIELDPEDAKKAKAFCKEVIAGDIEKFEWCDRLSAGFFDVAIFADVLEHLKDPPAVLERVKPFLKEDGYILVSVPNIANIAIRLELLLGSLEPEELGILDRTHLRYFTRKTLIQMMEGAGFYIDLVDYTEKGLPEAVIQEKLEIVGLRAIENSSQAFNSIDAVAFQFIAKGMKKRPEGYSPFVFQEIDKPQKSVDALFLKYQNELDYATQQLKKDDLWLREKDSLIWDLERKVREKEALLEIIQSGHAWRLLKKYFTLRDYLVPLGTKRRILAKRLLGACNFFKKEKMPKGSKTLGLTEIKNFLGRAKENLTRELLRKGGGFIDLTFPPGTKRRHALKKIIGWKSVQLQNIRLTKHPNRKIKNGQKYGKKEIVDEKITLEEDSNISVIIPTYNGVKDLTVLLPKLNNQRGVKSIEIIVVDSGSTDGSVEICKKNCAKVIEISQKEFSHSYARNLGAENAAQKYLLFMVQDALPSSELFIQNMLRSLKKHSAIAASCCEFLRVDADLFAQIQQWGHNRFLGMDGEDKIMSFPEKTDYVSLRRNSQLSDVACLIEKDVFLRYKYRNDFGEDLDLGLRLIKDNYKLICINTTKVIHSHTRSSYYILKRSLVDCTVLSKLFADFPKSKVDSKMFCEDIVFVYGLIQEIVLKGLVGLKTPCKSDIVGENVIEGLDRGFRSRYPRKITIEETPYVDSEFMSFVRAINAQYDPKSAILNYHGRLLADVKSYSDMAFDYLRQTYGTVDSYRMEDIISCLYKILAIVIGTHLSFYEYSENLEKREFFARLKNDLATGV